MIVYISAVDQLSNEGSIRLPEVETDAVQCCVRLYCFTVNVTTIIAHVYYQLTISSADKYTKQINHKQFHFSKNIHSDKLSIF